MRLHHQHHIQRAIFIMPTSTSQPIRAHLRTSPAACLPRHSRDQLDTRGLHRPQRFVGVPHPLAAPRSVPLWRCSLVPKDRPIHPS